MMKTVAVVGIGLIIANIVLYVNGDIKLLNFVLNLVVALYVTAVSLYDISKRNR